MLPISIDVHERQNVARSSLTTSDNMKRQMQEIVSTHLTPEDIQGITRYLFSHSFVKDHVFWQHQEISYCSKQTKVHGGFLISFLSGSLEHTPISHIYSSQKTPQLQIPMPGSLI